MINIGEISAFLIIQTIILLACSTVIFLFLWRNSRKKLSQYKISVEDQEEVPPTVSIEHYLTTEIKLTEGRFDLLFKDEDREHTDIVEPDCLVLRKKYLELEKEILETTDREDPFWASLGKNLRRMLEDCHLVKRLKLKATKEGAEEEIQQLQSIMEAQNEELDSLLAGLNSEDDELELEALKEKLSHCISVLEDENGFLRKQIKGLLEI